VDVVREANSRFSPGDDDWWIYILTFQNEWNRDHPNDRITNEQLGNYLDERGESTVKNARSRLKLSNPVQTRSDLLKRE
jgi:hypothetical protein